MDKVRIGIIGFGNMGSAHAKVIANGEIPGLALTCICDNDAAKRTLAAERYPHIPVYAEYAELLKSGLSAEALVEKMTAERGSLRVFAVLDTLEYLKKGGRISAATAFAGGLLSIKPVVEVRNGQVSLAGKARGSKNGNNLLRKLIGESRGIDFDRPYCVAFSVSSDALMRRYIEDSADVWQAGERELPTCSIGSVIGTHVGPGAVGAAFFEKDE